MPRETGPQSNGPEKPLFSTILRCPACGEKATQRLVKAHLVLAVPVPGKPFHRAFAWMQGTAGGNTSPLYHGICVCPECRYPGIESDFREAGDRAPVGQALRRLFAEKGAGLRAPLAAILGPFPETEPEPDRAVRLTLGAIAAQQMIYPEYWRLPVLARLYLRLTWLYLDELHLAWKGDGHDLLEGWHERGPGHDRFEAVLAKLAPVREAWRNMPLNEELARRHALRLHQKVYDVRQDIPQPEELVAEERLLAELYGLNGDLYQAAEMFGRALDSCLRLREEAYELHQTAWDRGLTISEVRVLATRVHRMGLLADEINLQANRTCGAQPRDIPRIRPLGVTAGLDDDEMHRQKVGIF